MTDIICYLKAAEQLKIFRRDTTSVIMNILISRAARNCHIPHISLAASISIQQHSLKIIAMFVGDHINMSKTVRNVAHVSNCNDNDMQLNANGIESVCIIISMCNSF